ncbi:TatD family hydrolase [Kurthia senegalensis]|uniref:TatD family hydrolase n=1 Tax=Kurthia senegalensis TaxID=1033740 RepID=UPI0002880F8C|nr:TatD family hydrolase [Kurthia senegalensis]
MIDIGLNLTEDQFAGKEKDVLARALEAGVQKMILTGGNITGSQRALEMAKRHPNVLYTTAGIHPHDAKSVNAQTGDLLRALYEDEQVIAVGECGLDFDRNYSEPKDQYAAFDLQLSIAEENDLPIFLHERAAHQQFIDVMKAHPTLIERSVVHCFTGDRTQLKAYLDLGFHIGVTGWVCDPKRGVDLREALLDMPLDRLMIETDAPYLIPKNIRPKPKSRTNEPKYLPHIGREIAQIMRVEEALFFNEVEKNTRRFFRI